LGGAALGVELIEAFAGKSVRVKRLETDDGSHILGLVDQSQVVLFQLMDMMCKYADIGLSNCRWSITARLWTINKE
jgi:hypothetical protein